MGLHCQNFPKLHKRTSWTNPGQVSGNDITMHRILSTDLLLQPWTKLLSHFHVIFNFATCNCLVERNKVTPLSTPCAMLFWPNSSRVHFMCYRKQHCNRGGENSLLICDGNNFGRASAENRYFCNVSQQVFFRVVGAKGNQNNQLTIAWSRTGLKGFSANNLLLHCSGSL